MAQRNQSCEWLFKPSKMRNEPVLTYFKDVSHRFPGQDDKKGEETITNAQTNNQRMIFLISGQRIEPGPMQDDRSSLSSLW